MRDGQRAEIAVFKNVYDTPVRQPLDDQPRQAFERYLIIER